MTEYKAPHEIITIKDADTAVVDRLAAELGVSQLLARILACRKLSTFEACKKYFRPELSDFHDPFQFEHMQKAVNRITAAINNHEKIVVHGDYDVDGVTATVLLIRVLKKMGAVCDCYLPNRLTEGYGMSIEGVDAISRQQGKVIITVDCGITAHKAIAHAEKLGIDVIVTDHHEAHEELPNACAILDPKVEGCDYPDKYLAGVGVALKLCQALARVSGYTDSLWMEHLDIVSLGTAADIVPLVGENRIIVKYGFKQLADTQSIGLRKLIAFQGIAGKRLSTSDVVFQLAPCINAAGRLGDSMRGVKLLLSEDEAEAALYAKELVEMNQERRALDAYVQDQASAWILDNIDLNREHAIVAGEADWHAGVIGIAASKMVEKFCRPAFLFSIDNDGLARGSGRSVRGLHLLDALSECSDLLETYGGHKAAAGASVKVENLPRFRARFNEAVSRRISLEELVPRVYADAEIEVAQLTPKFFNILKQMEPFGPGNMRPVLLCHDLRHRYEPRIVGKKHLKMTVTKEGQVMDAIAFNFGERFDEVKYSDNFSLAFSLEENTWNGRTTLQMKVKGVAL